MFRTLGSILGFVTGNVLRTHYYVFDNIRFFILRMVYW